MPLPRKVKRPDTRPYILTHLNLSPSAIILGKALGFKRSYEPLSYAPVIRWGNSMPLHSRSGDITTDSNLNNPAIIGICANKLRFHNAMEHLNIPHVEILSGIPERLPVVIRHNLEGSRGVGIEVVENPFQITGRPHINHGELERAWSHIYWSYWRNFSIELGVHIFNGKILRVFKKLPEENRIYQNMTDSEIEMERRFPIRNASRGWKFSLVNAEKYPKMIPLVQKFMDDFGLIFGRIDIGWNVDKKIYEIIEANSAPGLAENENTASMYIEEFKKLLERR